MFKKKMATQLLLSNNLQMEDREGTNETAETQRPWCHLKF